MIFYCFFNTIILFLFQSTITKEDIDFYYFILILLGIILLLIILVYILLKSKQE